MSDKAQKIDKRHSKQCVICYLIDSTAPKDTEWLIYKENYYSGNIEYICKECVDGVAEVRAKCIEQIDKPSKDILGEFSPWFFKHINYPSKK